MKALKQLIFLTLLLNLSCGDDIKSRRTIPGTGDGGIFEEQTADFSTRLRDDLMISGTNCDGNESTTYGGVTYNCAEDEWLITIDNINNCTNGTVCGEVVEPIVSRLSETTQGPSSEFRYYVIDPSSPVTDDQQTDIDLVWVRISSSGAADVVFR